MESLSRFAQEKLEELAQRGLLREIIPTDRHEAMTADRAGRPVVSFCDNDYLGLSQHPDVRQAAADAASDLGAGSGASRLISGSLPLNDAVEAQLAKMKGTEAAVLFGSGYLTNVGVIPVLSGPGDLILMDALCHNCLFAGAQLSQAKVMVFEHNDLSHLRSLLKDFRSDYHHTMIIVDGVYSMDGDLAPLPDISVLALEFDAWLMSDDAHGLGVLGGGRGTAFAFDDEVQVPLQMGTLSKSVGSYGGYLCADRPIIDLIKNRARSLVYTTGLPPAVLAASLKALQIIEEDEELCARPLALARSFTNALNLPDAQSSIVPVIIGDPETTLQASQKLLEAGLLVSAIRPPTVPEGTSRLRITFSATHRPEDIDHLIKSIRELDLLK